MSQRALEARVGALILVALLVLGGLAFALGGADYFESTKTLYVNFENPGGLKAGAPVRISGVKVGSVAAMHLRRTLEAAKTSKGRLPPIKVEIWLKTKHAGLVRADSRFYITVQGVLGEPYLAIEPGSPAARELKDGDTVTGVSPPRLDLILAESYEILHRAFDGIRSNEKEIAETFAGLHQTLTASGKFIQRNEGKLDKVVDNVEQLTREANETVVAARERYVDGPQARRILNNVEQGTGVLARDVPPLISDGRLAIQDVRKLTGALGSDDQVRRYKTITRDAEATIKDARGAVADAHTLVRDLKSGKGTAGALLRDEALYDDLQELLRDLKHHPWKFFWRE